MSKNKHNHSNQTAQATASLAVAPEVPPLTVPAVTPETTVQASPVTAPNQTPTAPEKPAQTQPQTQQAKVSAISKALGLSDVLSQYRSGTLTARAYRFAKSSTFKLKVETLAADKESNVPDLNDAKHLHSLATTLDELDFLSATSGFRTRTALAESRVELKLAREYAVGKRGQNVPEELRNDLTCLHLDVARILTEKAILQASTRKASAKLEASLQAQQSLIKSVGFKSDADKPKLWKPASKSTGKTTK